MSNVNSHYFLLLPRIPHGWPMPLSSHECWVPPASFPVCSRYEQSRNFFSSRRDVAGLRYCSCLCHSFSLAVYPWTNSFPPQPTFANLTGFYPSYFSRSVVAVIVRCGFSTDWKSLDFPNSFLPNTMDTLYLFSICMSSVTCLSSPHLSACFLPAELLSTWHSSWVLCHISSCKCDPASSDHVSSVFLNLPDAASL